MFFAEVAGKHLLAHHWIEGSVKLVKIRVFQYPPARYCLVTLANHASRDNEAFVVRDQGEITKGLSEVLLTGISVELIYGKDVCKPGSQLDMMAGRVGGHQCCSILVAITGAPVQNRSPIAYHSTIRADTFGPSRSIYL